jgi:hypothetical protein
MAFGPHEDQWAFLSSLLRLSTASVQNIVGEAESQGAF